MSTDVTAAGPGRLIRHAGPPGGDGQGGADTGVPDYLSGAAVGGIAVVSGVSLHRY